MRTQHCCGAMACAHGHRSIRLDRKAVYSGGHAGQPPGQHARCGMLRRSAASKPGMRNIHPRINTLLLCRLMSCAAGSRRLQLTVASSAMLAGRPRPCAKSANSDLHTTRHEWRHEWEPSITGRQQQHNSQSRAAAQECTHPTTASVVKPLTCTPAHDAAAIKHIDVVSRPGCSAAAATCTRPACPSTFCAFWLIILHEGAAAASGHEGRQQQDEQACPQALMNGHGGWAKA